MGILATLTGQDPSTLRGIVEADKTFCREKQLGSREWVNQRTRPGVLPQARPPALAGRRPPWAAQARRPSPPAKSIGTLKWQIRVLTVVDRAGAAQAHGLPDRGAKSLVAVLGGRVGADAVLCQDGARTGTGTTLFAPRRRARSRAMPHYRLDAKTGPRVIQKTCHIQTVTSLHSRGETFMRPSCGPAHQAPPRLRRLVHRAAKRR
jgi:hypothetical protein